jgi:hypothetical protein
MLSRVLLRVFGRTGGRDGRMQLRERVGFIKDENGVRPRRLKQFLHRDILMVDPTQEG